MAAPEIPANEDGRIAELQSYRVLDTPAEKPFDDIVKLAAYILDVPTALVSLIDTDRFWFLVPSGLKKSQAPSCLPSLNAPRDSIWPLGWKKTQGPSSCPALKSPADSRWPLSSKNIQGPSRLPSWMNPRPRTSPVKGVREDRS